MPSLSGLQTIEADSLKVRKPEGGIRRNIFECFPRKPEHIATLTNGSFDNVSDTHLVTTNALTQYVSLHGSSEVSQQIVTHMHLPQLGMDAADLAAISQAAQLCQAAATQIQTLEARISALETRLDSLAP